MIVEQLYTSCLAEAAYYIQSENEAVIIDPLRETAPYLELLAKNNATLKYIVETHFHADFVSGHVDLAKATGATIVYGPSAAPSFSAHVAQDNEVLRVGKVKLKVLHTPGHTLESSCYLLFDENDNQYCIFTGDTLFIGDVGRPDLVQKLKAEITPQILAGYLYESLRNKIMPLHDDIIIYPNHGAGSACGKNMSKETFDTLGHQKLVNYALNDGLTQEEFIKIVTEGLVEPPQYFPSNVFLNITGNEKSIDEIIKRSTKKYTAKDIIQLEKTYPNLLILDTRKKEEFCDAFIKDALFIGIDDNFAPWVGTLVQQLDTPILLVVEPGRETEAIVRLSRVGYDNCVGYYHFNKQEILDAGIEIDEINSTDAIEFPLIFNSDIADAELLDVRKVNEYKTEHIEGAINFPLDFIHNNIKQLAAPKSYYVHCAGGYRSVIAISVLKRHGFDKLVNILGGFNALKKTDLPLTDKLEVNNQL